MYLVYFIIRIYHDARSAERGIGVNAFFFNKFFLVVL